MWATSPRGRRAAGLGLPRDRHRSALGQEDRRAQRRRGGGGLRRPRRRAGAFILQTQNVANLHATPPLLEAIARNDDLVDLVNDKIRYLLLSGAHVDCDTLDLLRDIFPDTTITMAFGSTMILSQAVTRIDGDAFVFDPRTPYVVFWVVDPDTGERGALRAARPGGDEPHQQGHVHPEQPGTRHGDPDAGPAGQLGDSVSEVRPSPPSRVRPSSKACTDRCTRRTRSIDALGPDGEYRTRNREVISDTAGVPVAESEHRAAAVCLAHHQRATQGAPAAGRAARSRSGRRRRHLRDGVDRRPGLRRLCRR